MIRYKLKVDLEDQLDEVSPENVARFIGWVLSTAERMVENGSVSLEVPNHLDQEFSSFSMNLLFEQSFPTIPDLKARLDISGVELTDASIN